MRTLRRTPFTALVIALTATACGDKDVDDTGTSSEEADADTDADTDADADADTYAFTSPLTGGDSVSYSGQTMRHLLIADMGEHLGGMTDRLNEGAWYPVEGDVTEELEFYFEFDSGAYGQLDHLQDTDPAAAQTVYDDVSTDKDLVGKLAGNDETGQHKDWSTEFVGWDADEVTSPESLVRHWFAVIDAQAVDWSNGTVPLDPSGQPVPAVYVDAAGRDYQQLLQKFLLGAVAFSQGADDYLDDDTAGKGLLSDHSAVVDGKDYTNLEHQWDEGFGYFGAVITYGSWTDDQIADDVYMDVDGDGAIDLGSEMNWGAAVNAAKRDRGSQVGLDLTAEAWEGFLQGRALLSETAGSELGEEDFAALRDHRDQALGAWEAAMAATAVHYINDTLQDMGAMGTDDYSFGDHAKHWSELKGFALGLQFNRLSPLSDEDFAQVHAYIGTAPVLEDAGEEALSTYKADLLAARELIGTAYGFDATDLGDENGENGW